MWIVYGAWAWLIVSSLVVFNTRGDVAAANHALPGLLFVLVLHAGVWLYQKNKRPTSPQQPAPNPTSPTIDDSIYDQVAAELSINQIHAGLMARAIAEADGDKDKTQAIYIKLRVAAINSEQENEKQQGDQDFAQQPIAKSAAIMLGIIAICTGVMFAFEQNHPNEQQLSPELKKELDQLAKVHPDFDKIAMDPAFQEWIKNQPDSLKKLYASTSAEDNIVLLNIYKNTINN